MKPETVKVIAEAVRLTLEETQVAVPYTIAINALAALTATDEYKALVADANAERRRWFSYKATDDAAIDAARGVRGSDASS